MKSVNEISRMAPSPRLALGTILIVLFAAVAPVNAQYKPTGDDGITASPKVRVMLEDRKARTTFASAAVSARACPTTHKCGGCN
jgi:hypothetical protein